MSNFSLKTIYYTLIHLGVDNATTVEKQKKIILTNQISLLSGLAASPYFFIFYFAGFINLSLLIIPTVFVLLSCPFLNYFGKHRLANFLMMLDAYIAICFYSCSFGKDSGVQNLYFAFVGVPLVIFEKKDNVAKFLLIATSLTLLFLSELFNYSFFQKADISPYYVSLIFSTVTAITFIIIILTIQFYYSSNQKAEKKLQHINDQLQQSVNGLKDANLELITAYQDLKQSKELQTEMANQVAYAEVVRGIAHEIKNPLHMIRGSAEIIKDNPNSIQKNDNFCSVIISSVDRLIKVMEPMMKYGRSITQFEPTLFYVTDLLEEIQKLSEGSCRKKQLKLTIGSEKSLQIFADRQNIAQVLINLVLNAQQYTPEKGSINLIAHETVFNDSQNTLRKGVCIAVIDSGKGISKENLAKIFDPFFTSKKEQHNMGLGLSIVFRYVTENNGKIEVESEENVGTTFKICLPSDVPDTASPFSPKTPSIPPTGILPSPKKSDLSDAGIEGKIFFADDLF